MSLELWRQNRATPRTLLDEVWSALDDFDPRFGTRNRTSAVINTACDIAETEESFVLSFDVPGVKRDDINIEITGRQLTVSGERKREEESGNGTSYRLERNFGKFQRSFELPDGTDTDKIEASYEHGVLKIAVPKAGTGKTKKIQIGDEGKSFLQRLTTKHDIKTANA